MQTTTELTFDFTNGSQKPALDRLPSYNKPLIESGYRAKEGKPQEIKRFWFANTFCSPISLGHCKTREGYCMMKASLFPDSYRSNDQKQRQLSISVRPLPVVTELSEAVFDRVRYPLGFGSWGFALNTGIGQNLYFSHLP